MRIMILLAAALLVGCTTMTPASLRAEGEHYSFNADQDLESVYRTVVEKARECRSEYYRTHYYSVENIEHNDTADVIINYFTHRNDVGPVVVVDIEKKGDNSTSIDVSYHKEMDELGLAVKDWVLAGGHSC